MTFRLLVWLRWKLWLRTSTRRGRWAGAALLAVFALAFAPFYVGGAIGAYAAVRRLGPAGVTLTFAAAQAVWVWTAVASGALARLYDPDQILRYPVRAWTVQVVNVLACAFEPLALMTFPALAAVVLATAQTRGAAAAAGAAVGAALLVLLTAGLVQLLIAALDDLLRREWVRYTAGLLLVVPFVGVQVLVRRATRPLRAAAAQGHLPGLDALRHAATLLGRVPTIGAPAALAGGDAWPPYAAPAAAAAVTLALLAGALVLGTLAFARAARRAPTVGGGAPTRTRRASGRGGFGLRLPFVSREGALLVARDLRCMLRTPPQLLSVVLTPLIVIPAYLFTRTGPGGGSGLAILLLLTTLTGPNLMMFGWDGPGVRSLFLLPLGSRDVVLAKNLFYLGIVGAQAALVVLVLALLRVSLGGGLFAAVVLGYAALAFVATTIGTYVSIFNPVRPPRRGFARRGPGGAPSLIGLLALGVAGGAVVVLVLFARFLAPATLKDTAGALAALGCLAVAVVVWWLGVQRGGEEFVRRRETLIDVLAKDEGS